MSALEYIPVQYSSATPHHCRWLIIRVAFSPFLLFFAMGEGFLDPNVHLVVGLELTLRCYRPPVASYQLRSMVERVPCVNDGCVVPQVLFAGGFDGGVGEGGVHLRWVRGCLGGSPFARLVHSLGHFSVLVVCAGARV